MHNLRRDRDPNEESASSQRKTFHNALHIMRLHNRNRTDSATCQHRLPTGATARLRLIDFRPHPHSNLGRWISHVYARAFLGHCCFQSPHTTWEERWDQRPTCRDASYTCHSGLPAFCNFPRNTSSFWHRGLCSDHPGLPPCCILRRHSVFGQAHECCTYQPS